MLSSKNACTPRAKNKNHKIHNTTNSDEQGAGVCVCVCVCVCVGGWVQRYCS